MQNVIEQYKEAVVNVMGVFGGLSLLAYGCAVYRGLIEQVLDAIFYK